MLLCFQFKHSLHCRADRDRVGRRATASSTHSTTSQSLSVLVAHLQSETFLTFPFSKRDFSHFADWQLTPAATFFLPLHPTMTKQTTPTKLKKLLAGFPMLLAPQTSQPKHWSSTVPSINPETTPSCHSEELPQMARWDIRKGEPQVEKPMFLGADGEFYCCSNGCQNKTSVALAEQLFKDTNKMELYFTNCQAPMTQLIKQEKAQKELKGLLIHHEHFRPHTTKTRCP